MGAHLPHTACTPTRLSDAAIRSLFTNSDSPDKPPATTCGGGGGGGGGGGDDDNGGNGNSNNGKERDNATSTSSTTASTTSSKSSISSMPHHPQHTRAENGNGSSYPQWNGRPWPEERVSAFAPEPTGHDLAYLFKVSEWVRDGVGGWVGEGLGGWVSERVSECASE